MRSSSAVSSCRSAADVAAAEVTRHSSVDSHSYCYGVQHSVYSADVTFLINDWIFTSIISSLDYYF